MPSKTSVLIYGRDSDLLETRRLLLKSAGFSVFVATETDAVARLVPLEQIDLMVLCHTLTTEQCAEATALVHACWPELMTVVLTAGGRGCKLQSPNKILDALDGPEKFLQTVAELVHVQLPVNFAPQPQPAR